MAGYHVELLDTAQNLLARDPRRSGLLSVAQVRRSVSTCYYALFHFLVDDACRRLVGSERRHLARRHIATRSFTHTGIKSALSRVRGKTVDKGVADFMRSAGDVASTVAAPDFARFMASIFIDAQAQRHDADYDLNTLFSETDARELQEKARDAIQYWQSATTVEAHDFKDALAILMLLRGQLRTNDRDLR